MGMIGWGIGVVVVAVLHQIIATPREFPGDLWSLWSAALSLLICLVIVALLRQLRVSRGILMALALLVGAASPLIAHFAFLATKK
jgi:hypothetical protein